MLPFSLLNFSRINVKSSSKILYWPESAHSNACTIRYTLAIIHPLHTTHSMPPLPIKLYMYIRCMHDYHMLTSPDMNGELWKTRHSRVGLQCHTTERQSLAAEARIYRATHVYDTRLVTRSRSQTRTHRHTCTSVHGTVDTGHERNARQHEQHQHSIWTQRTIVVGKPKSRLSVTRVYVITRTDNSWHWTWG